MANIPIASAIRGKTIRFIWSDGPTKGSIHEHVFHPDGTVEWHDAQPGGPAKKEASGKAKERPHYAAFEVTPEVSAVSYLAPSGFTLTTVLNFSSGKLVGFASGQGQWFPVQGTFEVVA